MGWVEPTEWYANLAAFHAAAALFITDTDDRVLLVKPTYRDHWSLPGGYIDQDEAPHAAAERELREELDIDVTAGALLVIDWAPPAGARTRALMNLLFDGGQVANLDEAHLDHQEIEMLDFHTPESCMDLLPVRVAPRIGAALDARRTGSTVYLSDGRRPEPARYR